MMATSTPFARVAESVEDRTKEMSIIVLAESVTEENRTTKPRILPLHEGSSFMPNVITRSLQQPHTLRRGGIGD